MRKGHSDVINRMKKADFPEKVVSEFEEMTDLSLSGIRKRMEFAYAHRTIVSEIGDAYKLVMKLTDEIELELDGKCEEFLHSRFGKTWFRYWLRMDVFLYGFGLDDIMYVRENYRKGIYSAEDCVSISMLVYPRHDDRHTCLDADSAYEIINTRREYGIQESWSRHRTFQDISRNSRLPKNCRRKKCFGKADREIHCGHVMRMTMNCMSSIPK